MPLNKSVADFMDTHELIVTEQVQKTVPTPKMILPIKDVEAPMPPQTNGNQHAVIELVSLNTSDMKMLTTGLREKFLQLQSGADKRTIDEANAMVGITGQFISLAKVEMMAIKHSQQKK